MNDFIKILIADDQDMSLELMSSTLWKRGYTVFQAKDGEEALRIAYEEDPHLAILDVNLKLVDGLAFAKKMLVDGRDLPCILITDVASSDLLTQAIKLNVDKVLQKPVAPAKLQTAVERIINKLGLSSKAIFVRSHESTKTPEELMEKAIALAEQNARSGKGRPFGAVVSDKQGHILGTGTNGIASRVDPSAHAEVIAIRQAAEMLGEADLSDCILYCSGEPTKIGKALIESVAIGEVYYALSHEEVFGLRKEEKRAQARKIKVKQMSHDLAFEKLSGWLE